MDDDADGWHFEPDWLDRVARVTAIAAIVFAAVEILNWVAQFSIVEPVIAVIGGEGFFWIFRWLFVIRIAASVVVAAGLFVGWRASRPLWAHGVALVASGIVLDWAWWALNQFGDVWGYRQLAETDSAELARLSQLHLGVDLGLSVAVIVLLIWGARRLSRPVRAS